MEILRKLYRDRLALATDLYQLTMSYGYWKAGVAHKEAAFNLFFRHNPFKGGYAVSCGLTYLLDYLNDFRFDASDLEYLETLRGNDGKPLFEKGFLDYLADLRFSCDIDAMPEGTVAFPHEPMVRVQGPIIQAQILETPLLNIMNFQTLVATKAARICEATRGESVLEFGLRRAQGMDGALAASWAAHVGGCYATSNVLAGKMLGIPVRGTHAHSWIMSFDSEEQAFQAYAEAMPNNCIFLVDTYDTLTGVRKATEVGKWLHERGFKMAGIRLDSGDLAYLSIEARKILDEAGFKDAVIVASNDLDEYIIHSLKEQGSTITVWGVGTKLVTAYDQPALGGVYKLAAVRNPGEKWQHKIKLSEQTIKISNPGVQQVRRYFNEKEFLGDMIFDAELGAPDSPVMVDPLDLTKRKQMRSDTHYYDLLTPIYRGGKAVYQQPKLEQIRQYAHDQRQRLHSGIRRFVNPHRYPVGLEQRLFDLKTKLILDARGFAA
ncbi:MAG: nicotinate phosphoribosyltransferase [Verrucomicrobiota bacterium]